MIGCRIDYSENLRLTGRLGELHGPFCPCDRGATALEPDPTCRDELLGAPG
ncbi:hypothetical protein ACFYRC_06275 [Streptomyces sp. NPDC005279]|uniref:hypothetical protein n=1 Tax=Streptomyces sp. NPDC005279 TaxID=3364712 RepID=UPI00368133C6